MTTPVQVWDSFAATAKPRRAVNAAGVTTWLNWTQYPDHGPDESVLGPVSGKRVLELGCGAGANLAHVATLGARCVGVDIAPTRIKAAAARWGTAANLEFVTADAVDHLTGSRVVYDVVFSIFGAVWFTDPAVLLPAVHDALAPGGVLAFSHLPASDAPGPARRLITKHHLSTHQWHQALEDAGFDAISAEIIPAPGPDQPGTLLVHARRGRLA
ncbi:class I SAM-dependent methyltransferase [Amycolatopsis nigrescens]|uniref:class I SAM-dependent methyltransferase n=1 Tax=Amycolatopsis nigrescens TaxID=381445 RepID=UPI0003752142|nr:class I SAM-dependent methyltransferase [Amycolatopsis nigrescens]